MAFRRIARRSVLSGIGGAVIAGAARAQDCDLHVHVELNGWTDLTAWAERLTPEMIRWWPVINKAIGVPGCATKTIKLQFFEVSPTWVAAEADHDHVVVNAPYVLANLNNQDMVRLVAHELVHLAQAYPEGAKPVWLTEGIADYVRYYVMFPNDPGRFFAPSSEGWSAGYSATAGMLAFAEGAWPGLVPSINRAMKAGGDGEAALIRLTALKPAELWARYLASQPDAASECRQKAYRDSLKAS